MKKTTCTSQHQQANEPKSNQDSKTEAETAGEQPEASIGLDNRAGLVKKVISSPKVSTQTVLQLQRYIGNKAVTQLIAQRKLYQAHPGEQIQAPLNVIDRKSLNNAKTASHGQASKANPGPAKPGLTQIIQRAVGFEFEDGSWNSFAVQDGKKFRTPWWIDNYWASTPATPPASKSNLPGKNIYATSEADHINNDLAEYNLESAAKKGQLHQGKNYKIEPDGPYDRGMMDIEFVTEPFPETKQGREKLEAALKDMDKVMTRLHSVTSRNHQNGEFVEPDEHEFSTPNIYLSGGGKSKGRFKVQATQGLPLDKLPSLMKALGTSVPNETESETSKRDEYRKLVRGTTKTGDVSDIMGSAPSVAQKVIEQLLKNKIIGDKEETGKLQGFLSAMVMYIQLLSYAPKTGIKETLPLMSRYSFPELFKKLPVTQQETLQENIVKFIDALEIGLATYSKNRVTSMSDPIFKDIEKTPISYFESGKAEKMYATSMTNALNSLTPEIWVAEIVEGHDLLKPDELIDYFQRKEAPRDQKKGVSEYGKSIGIFLRGHGNSDRIEDVDKDTAIFENRAILPAGKEIMTMEEAAKFALSYFDMLRLIKESKL